MHALAMTIAPATDDAAPDPDAELARRAAGGEVRAFEALYRSHAARVHGAMRRLCGGVEARAQELTQDAFVRAWQKLPGFRFESRFGTWLYRLAINVALMDLRARRGAEDQESTLDETVLQLAAPQARVREHGIDLERSVAALPPRARAVLVLHDIEGWTHEEIGTELGMAIGTSKAQLHRARGLLRRALGD
jgi:RNA polymerase sigma-70 factor (ECF subfamily)